MQPTCTLATLSSRNSAIEQHGGAVTNVQTVIPTDGRHGLDAGAKVQAVHNAAAASYASTTRLQPWHQQSLLSGTVARTAALQTWCLLGAINQLIGTAARARMTGLQSQPKRHVTALGAQNAIKVPLARGKGSTRPLHSVSILSWQSGTMTAMLRMASSLQQ